MFYFIFSGKNQIFLYYYRNIIFPSPLVGHKEHQKYAGSYQVTAYHCSHCCSAACGQLFKVACAAVTHVITACMQLTAALQLVLQLQFEYNRLLTSDQTKLITAFKERSTNQVIFPYDNWPYGQKHMTKTVSFVKFATLTAACLTQGKFTQEAWYYHFTDSFRLN